MWRIARSTPSATQTLYPEFRDKIKDKFKEYLALKVKEYVPRFYIHFAPIGQDPDQRNYIVSNERLRQVGFAARRTLDDGIKELLKGYRMEGRPLFHNAA